MFERGNDDDSSLSDALENIRSSITRTQDSECDFCGSSDGSVIKSKDEAHPEVAGSPPVVRCRDCYNNPETYHD